MPNFIKVKMKRFFSINRFMIPAKITYLVYGGVLACFLPYLNVFFVSVGLSPSEAGIITGIRYGASCIAGPIWGVLTDYTGRRKLIIAMLTLGAAFPLVSMPCSAYLIHPISSNVTCDNVQSNTSSNISSGTNNISCSESDGRSLTMLFYTLLGLMALGSIFMGPIVGYIDSLVMSLVESGKTKTSYGKQRIFGSVGSSLTSFLLGVALDNFQCKGMSHYAVVFFILFPLTLLLLPLGCYMVRQVDWNNIKTASREEEERERNIEENKVGMAYQIFLIFKKFDFNIFLVTVFVSGTANSLYVNFALLLLGDEMKRSKTDMSMVMTVGTISEIIIFPLTSKLIKLLGGPSTTMAFGIFSYFIRYIGMSYTTQYWLMIALQGLNGFGYALTYAAILEHIHNIIPSEIIVTMFLVISSIYQGISSIIGNIAGGKIYHLYGGRVLFRNYSIICGVWSIIILVYYGRKLFVSKNRQKAETRVSYGREKEIETVNDSGIDNHGQDIEDKVFTVTLKEC